MNDTTLLDHTGARISAVALPAAVAKPAALSSETATPMELLQRAVQNGADLAMIEKLMDLQDRWEKNEARKAFVQALAEFKAEPLRLVKDRHVSFMPKNSNVEVSYDHASLGQICDAAGPALGKHGLSYRWKTDQIEGGMIVVTCILTHKLGHSEEVTLKAGRDETGSKNNIQSVASTITYLERYTLMAITGLAAADQDDDGHGSEDGEDTISEEQYQKIAELMAETGASLDKFLDYFKIEGVADLPAWRYPDALAMLEQKKAKKTGPMA